MGRPTVPRTPEELHERELHEWGRLNERVRARIGVELDYFDKLPTVQGPDGGNLDSHLLVCDMLLKLSTTVSNIMERGMRLQQTKPAQPDEDPAVIERELLGA